MACNTVSHMQVDSIRVREEEELIRKLFTPTADAQSLCGEEHGISTTVSTQSVFSGKEGEDSSSNGSGEQNTSVGYGPTSPFTVQAEDLLADAEQRFLTSDHCRSSEVSLEEIANRFSTYNVPKMTSLDEEGVKKYLDAFVKNAVDDSVNTAAPTMIGHMTSSLPYFIRPLSRLVTSLNQNCVKTETANTMTFLEREAMAQLHRQFYGHDISMYEEVAQNPSKVLGVFTSGGTIANVTALWVARNLALPPQPASEGREAFLGVEQEGLFEGLKYYGYDGIALVGSELLHYSMAKAADILGLGVKALQLVPYDDNFQVRIDLLEAKMVELKEKNICIVSVLGIAGATETGTIDDLAEVARIAEAHDVHFHVDAAWGGPAIFSSTHNHLLKGIELADSITVDGHKQLYMPMGAGMCFFRDPNACLAVQKTAKYIIRKDSYDMGKFTLEGSRPANAIYLHSNLNILGVHGYEILVDRSIRMTRFMANRIRQSNGLFELVVDPVLNILLYRLVPDHLWEKSARGEKMTAAENIQCDQLNVKLQSAQTLEGRTFVSRTTVNSLIHKAPVVALRVVIANPLTTEDDIDKVLQNQMEIASKLLNIDESQFPEPNVKTV